MNLAARTEQVVELIESQLVVGMTVTNATRGWLIRSVRMLDEPTTRERIAAALGAWLDSDDVHIEADLRETYLRTGADAVLTALAKENPNV